ncbi:MAG: DUF945 family protein [Pseudomonadota bacterium]
MGGLLAAALLLGPLLIGRFGDSVIERQLDRLAASSDMLAVTRDAGRSGWFSSETVHRIIVTDDAAVDLLRRALGGAPFADQPAVIVATARYHGPLPAGGGPGLQRTVSTLALDTGDGNRIELPGQLTTAVGFDGRMGAVLTLQEVTTTLAGGGRLDFAGADATMTGSLTAGKRDTEARFAGLALSSATGSLDVGRLTLTQSKQQTDHPAIFVGDGRFAWDGFSWTPADGTPVGIEDAQLTTRSELTDGALDIDVEAVADRVQTEVGERSFRAHLALAGLDPAAASDLVVMVQNGDGDLTQLDPAGRERLLDIGERLAAGGARLRLDKLEIGTPDGLLRAAVSAGFEPGREVSGWTGLMRVLSGEAMVEAPAALLGNPVYGWLHGVRSFFETDDGTARLKLEIDAGTVTVNGVAVQG